MNAAQFWTRVNRSGVCWEYPGNVPGTHRKVQFEGAAWGAHRLAWTLTYGPIPDGMFVCHKCDNPPCCNPEHLFLGTNAENIRDMVAKGRHPFKDGHLAVRRIDGPTREAITLEYNAGGITMKALADRHGVTLGAIRSLIVVEEKRLGIKRRTKAHIPAALTSQIVEDYRRGGVTTRELAVRYDIGKSTVQVLVKRAARQSVLQEVTRVGAPHIRTNLNTGESY